MYETGGALVVGDWGAEGVAWVEFEAIEDAKEDPEPCLFGKSLRKLLFLFGSPSEAFVFILSAASAAALLSMFIEGCECSRASAADIEAAPCGYRYGIDTVTIVFRYSIVKVNVRSRVI